MNQCDGCRSGLKMKGEILHVDKAGRAVMVCQKFRYEDIGRCQCSLRVRLVGDGCRYCNPNLASELAQDDK